MCDSKRCSNLRAIGAPATVATRPCSNSVSRQRPPAENVIDSLSSVWSIEYVGPST